MACGPARPGFRTAKAPPRRRRGGRRGSPAVRGGRLATLALVLPRCPPPTPSRKGSQTREGTLLVREGEVLLSFKGANAPFDPPGESALKSLRADSLIDSIPHR